MTEPLDLDAIEESYLGYDPDYPVFRLISAVRERDAEIARLRAPTGADAMERARTAIAKAGYPEDLVEAAAGWIENVVTVVALALQQYGDERAAAARAAAIEEAALVCDGRSAWAEVQITDDDTRPYAAYSIGCDACAEMIRALAEKPGCNPVHKGATG